MINEEGDGRRKPGSELSGMKLYARQERRGREIETWRKRKLQYCLIFCDSKSIKSFKPLRKGRAQLVPIPTVVPRRTMMKRAKR